MLTNTLQSQNHTQRLPPCPATLYYLYAFSHDCPLASCLSCTLGRIMLTTSGHCSSYLFVPCCTGSMPALTSQACPHYGGEHSSIHSDRWIQPLASLPANAYQLPDAAWQISFLQLGFLGNSFACASEGVEVHVPVVPHLPRRNPYGSGVFLLVLHYGS